MAIKGSSSGMKRISVEINTSFPADRHSRYNLYIYTARLSSSTPRMVSRASATRKTSKRLKRRRPGTLSSCSSGKASSTRMHFPSPRSPRRVIIQCLHRTRKVPVRLHDCLLRPNCQVPLSSRRKALLSKICGRVLPAHLLQHMLTKIALL